MGMERAAGTRISKAIIREIEMNFPIGPEDVTIVGGHSGRGLQVMCPCGCVNWNHVEISEATWRCRNCARVFTYNYPALVLKVLAQQKQEAPAPVSGAAT